MLFDIKDYIYMYTYAVYPSSLAQACKLAWYTSGSEKVKNDNEQKRTAGIMVQLLSMQRVGVILTSNDV